MTHCNPSRRWLKVALCFFLYLPLVAHAADKRNLAVGAAAPEASEQRLALVIGNSAYQSAPLKNPVHDAQDMSAKLRGMGFEVIERRDLHVKQISATLRESEQSVQQLFQRKGLSVFFERYSICGICPRYLRTNLFHQTPC